MSAQIPDRPMVTVERILEIQQIEGADNIECASVKGWHIVVSKKDNFKSGDLCGYAQIDSIFPTEFESTAFLESKPLKTRKIRGVYSQGLVFPLEWVSQRTSIENLTEGQDLTEIIGVLKYTPPEEFTSHGTAVCDADKFPTDLLPKTDEPRIQNAPYILERIKEIEIFVTRKEDGCSATYLIDLQGNFLRCSRNLIVRERTKNTAHYYDAVPDIEEILRQNPKLAFQGEIVGPGINSNRLKLNTLEFRVFNIFNLETHSYINADQMFEICSKLKLATVPLLYQGVPDERFQSVKSCLTYTDTLDYCKNSAAEGIVIRNLTHTISFKVISNRYLMKNKL